MNINRVILSRKGFDGAAGKQASPIFSDNTLFSLPIPQKRPSPNKYGDLFINQKSGEEAFIEAGIGKNLNLDSFCHYDPMILPEIGLFGQVGNAQGILEKRGVGVGDLFIFFGWFKKYFQKKSDCHHIFGWLQIDEIIKGSDAIINYLKTINVEHPHGYGDLSSYRNNTLYVGTKKLVDNSIEMEIPGFGLFPKSSSELILTNKGSSKSIWEIPFEGEISFGMEGVFMSQVTKWHDQSNNLISSGGRGQEIVLNSKKNPAIKNWAINLISKNS